MKSPVIPEELPVAEEEQLAVSNPQSLAPSRPPIDLSDPGPIHVVMLTFFMDSSQYMVYGLQM